MPSSPLRPWHGSYPTASQVPAVPPSPSGCVARSQSRFCFDGTTKPSLRERGRKPAQERPQVCAQPCSQPGKNGLPHFVLAGVWAGQPPAAGSCEEPALPLPPLQLPRQPVPSARWTRTASGVPSLASLLLSNGIPARFPRTNLLTVTSPAGPGHSPTAARRNWEAQRQHVKRRSQPATVSCSASSRQSWAPAPLHAPGFSYAAVLKAKRSLRWSTGEFNQAEPSSSRMEIRCCSHSTADTPPSSKDKLLTRFQGHKDSRRSGSWMPCYSCDVRCTRNARTGAGRT